MWFKNIHIFRFTKPFNMSAETLEELLEKDTFSPCSSQETAKYGWVAPLGKHGSQLVHTCSGKFMLCSKRQEKLLPASVINEKLAEKVDLIEDQEARKLSRKEKQALKEEIHFDLLPKAFTRSTILHAYIDPNAGLLIINSSSEKRAEELCSALRESIGSLPVIPLGTKNIPLQVMSNALLNAQNIEGFSYGHECELKDLGEQGSLIRCKQQNLLSDEINALVKGGMQVTKLHLSWQDQLDFIIDEKLAIKRIKFSDLLLEKAGHQNTDDMAEQFDVDFSIMAAELAGLIQALEKAFGGFSDIDSEKLLKEKMLIAE